MISFLGEELNIVGIPTFGNNSTSLESSTVQVQEVKVHAPHALRSSATAKHTCQQHQDAVPPSPPTTTANYSTSCKPYTDYTSYTLYLVSSRSLLPRYYIASFRKPVYWIGWGVSCHHRHSSSSQMHIS